MTDRTRFDENYLPYLVAYFLECANSGEYPDVEIAGRLRQVDESVRVALKHFGGSTVIGRDLPQALFDTWVLLAYARVVGSKEEMSSVYNDAISIGVIRSSSEFEAVEMHKGSLSEADLLTLEHLNRRAAYFHGEIGGALDRTSGLGQPGSDVSEMLTDAQDYMRDLRDLFRILSESLVATRGMLTISTLPTASKASLASIEGISEMLPKHLEPSERVAIAAPATWVTFAEEAGIGTFQGVLLVTSENVRFLFNRYHHENYWDLPDSECFPWSLVLRFVKVTHRVTMDNGYKLKVGSRLDLLLVSERLLNPRHSSFFVPEDRMSEFTKFR